MKNSKRKGEHNSEDNDRAGNIDDSTNHKLITAKSLAGILSISERTVWNFDSEGRLPEPLRLGRIVRWRMKEIDEWITEGCPNRARWQAMKN